VALPLYAYYVINGHGDVIALTNEAGQIVNSYTYDEWGNTLAKQEQVANPIRYSGEYYDEESGLYYLRARYYDPSTGRFISKDPVEGNVTNPLSLNSYTYCLNNPIIYIDPSGCTTLLQARKSAEAKFYRLLAKVTKHSNSNNGDSNSFLITLKEGSRLTVTAITLGPAMLLTDDYEKLRKDPDFYTALKQTGGAVLLAKGVHVTIITAAAAPTGGMAVVKVVEIVIDAAGEPPPSTYPATLINLGTQLIFGNEK